MELLIYESCPCQNYLKDNQNHQFIICELLDRNYQRKRKICNQICIITAKSKKLEICGLCLVISLCF